MEISNPIRVSISRSKLIRNAPFLGDLLAMASHLRYATPFSLHATPFPEPPYGSRHRLEPTQILLFGSAHPALLKGPSSRASLVKFPLEHLALAHATSPQIY